MIFKVGDTVVYPHHGAALVEAIETRTIKGEQKEYLVLKVAQGDLTVRVPADNAEYVGVRRPLRRHSEHHQRGVRSCKPSSRIARPGEVVGQDQQLRVILCL